MISYYISEQGRIIKIDIEERKFFIFKEYLNNQAQWISIRLNKTNSENDFQLHFRISNHYFLEMKKIVLSKRGLPLVADYYFITKSNQKSYFFPAEAFAELQILNFDKSIFNNLLKVIDKQRLINPTIEHKKGFGFTEAFAKLKEMICGTHAFERLYDINANIKDQLAYLTANPILLCKAAAYVREQVEHLRESPKNEISTVKELQLFADKEIQRLSQPDIWNGPAKAQGINQAKQKLDAWMEDEDMLRSPAMAARESGLLTALAQHRHLFFSPFKKTTALKSILEKCPILESRI